jgi:hypothetical protein
MRKLAASGLCLMLFVTPALATQYVVVQDSSTHKCAVIAKTPAGPARGATAFSSTYNTHADAEAAMGRMRACGIAD